MHQGLLTEILNTIHDYIENVPKGRILLENTDFINIEQLLSVLYDVFKLEEDAIKKEKNQPFMTDTYENNVRYFAQRLMISMIPYHKQLKEYEVNYKKLLGQRHVAYGFYAAIELGVKYDKTIFEDSSFEKSLYLGLVEFYQNFYGSFSDNEEAIKLLCKFYPKKILLDGKTDDIASAAFPHITNAGTPSDAYKGIALINKYIGNLPIEIINKILQKYELYRIINEKVYRHQIFTIIENSIMSDKEKRKYKFSYLDSLLLANYMNKPLYKKYEEHDSNQVTRYFIPHTTNLSVDKIELFDNSKTDSIYAYWTNGRSTKRHFIVDERVVIKISLDVEKKQIRINYTNSPMTSIGFAFRYEDWILENYQTKETEQKLLDFVFEVSNGEKEIIYNNLTFSLLYLSNYRGINEQLVDFDHQFTYDKIANELKLSTVSPVIPHFYGKKIHSLSCIVGKNGTGKTSTVDFLRSTFFKLIILIGEGDVACENGYVSPMDYKKYGILDKDCEFFVVFQLGSKSFYLTNIVTKAVTLAKPFKSSAYQSSNELSKVVYFSNKLSVSQDDLYIDEGGTLRNEHEIVAKSLNNFRQVDYSEAASFIQKRKVIDVAKSKNNSPMVVNKDLCYQLAFLGYLTRDQLMEYFDMTVEKVFTLKSASLNIKGIPLTVEHTLKDILGNNSEELKSILKAPDGKLDYFSSGQYAKFSFLSKLYWFLEGYRKYSKDFESIFETKVFTRDEALGEGESALIFIDEGELYYHPEWQRSYIKTLVDNIEYAKTEAILQVVVTTNSPFIISDILSEDITYLSKEEKDFDRTFGQNIHKLLKDNFFMSYTIGAYSQEVIEKIMKWLLVNKKDEINNSEENEDNISEETKLNVGEELSRYFGEPIEPKDYYKKISCLIGKIGEPIYREKLLDTLNKSELGNTFELQKLLIQQAEIEQKIKELQKGR